MEPGNFRAIALLLGMSATLKTVDAVQAQALSQHSISLQMARTAADAALAACKTAGFEVTVAVVDRSGALTVLLKSDTASPHSADLARRKAYTARTFASPSMAFQKWSVDALAGQRNLADVIALGGGMPIMMGKEAIGAIGVSGTPNQEQDEQCATAGVTALAAQLHEK